MRGSADHGTNAARANSMPPGGKKPFDVTVVLGLIRAEVGQFADAAMFALRDAGFGDTFQQLVGCMISIRTRDEVSLPAAIRLLKRAPDAETMSRMEAAEIDELIHPATFHLAKAHQIRDMAVRITEEMGGDLPCDFDTLTSFKGIGPKCANLALGIACGEKAVSVDVHVQRVTNRWGYVQTRTAEQTREALEGKLPRQFWIEINRLLVPFGKHVCTGSLPRCSVCPVLEYCHQVGVEAHR
jgi:endonuclease III